MIHSASRSPEDVREPLASVWFRRALSVPAYLFLAGVCLVVAPVWFLAAAAADALAGQATAWPRIRALGFFALYFIGEAAGIFAAVLIEVVTLGGRIGGSSRYLRANAALQRWWTSSLFKGGLHLFAMNVEAEGLDLARSGPFILFVRHASAADSVLAAALVANPNHLLLRYALKRELRWDPCLDIVGSRLPNAFIARNGIGGQAATDAVTRLAMNLDEHSAALVFPEGTRFAPTKLAAAVAALKAGRPELAEIASGFRHVLPPRLGGALAMLEAAPGVDVILLEHTGFEGTTTFADFWKGGLVGRTLQVRLRRFASDSIPATGRDQWLFERWAEMDEWIYGTLHNTDRRHSSLPAGERRGHPNEARRGSADLRGGPSRGVGAQPLQPPPCLGPTRR